MRYTIFIIFFLATGGYLSAQTQKRSIGIYTSFGNYWQPGSFNAPKNKATYLLGAEYGFHLSPWLQLMTGLEFSDHDVSWDQSHYTTIDIRRGHIQLLTSVLYLRADVLKFLFFTFGFLGDLQVKNAVTPGVSGMGITGGTGFKMDLKKHTTVFIHPFYQVHDFVSFWNATGEKGLVNLGIRTGFSYRF